MTMVQVLPWIAAAGMVAAMVLLAGRTAPASPGAWQMPAGLAALFLLWSLAAVVVEGPLGFWAEHTRNRWGNQIWFDLLLGIGTAWALVLPRARRVGMQPWPWLVLILCSGSIGLLAMVARLLQLEARRASA